MKFSEQKFDIFDEEHYLQNNPDVREAWLRGEIVSGLAHYAKFGENEGRSASPKQIRLSQIVEDMALRDKQDEIRKICENFSCVSKYKKKKKTVIFYTPRYFEGNLKYTFMEMVARIERENLDLACFFLTLNPDTFSLLNALNLPVLFWRGTGSDIAGRLLDAAVIVDDGFFIDGPPNPPLLYAYLSGARRVNLWHGTPLRKILLQKLQANRHIDLHYSTILKAAVNNNVFCGAAAGDCDLFGEAMSIDEFFVTGYARNDLFYREITKHDLVNVDERAYAMVRDKNGDKIAWYAPTWRDGRPEWVREIELGKLAALLKHRGIRLFVNLHPFEMTAQREYLQGIPDLTLIEDNTDIYPVMKYVDIMITDYSSIVFDYLHTGKPVIYFRPDHELYLSGNRALIAERIDRIPVPTVYDAQTCADRVIDALSDESYPTKLADEVKRAHHYQDAGGSRRCASVVLKTVEDVVSSQSTKRPLFIETA
jgi:CDP-glycerol glycerophosphotransferase (TagB/SpsB family)